MAEAELTQFSPELDIAWHRYEPGDVPVPEVGEFEDLADQERAEVMRQLDLGRAAVAGLAGKEHVIWTGEEAVLDALADGTVDYINPSWSHPEGHPERVPVFELIKLDDSKLADRLASAILMVAGRAPRGW